MIISYLDYCNCLLSGLPSRLPIHSATRLTYLVCCSGNIQSLFKFLHWLPPISIRFKLLVLAFTASPSLAHCHLSAVVSFHSLPCPLCSGQAAHLTVLSWLPLLNFVTSSIQLPMPGTSSGTLSNILQTSPLSSLSSKHPSSIRSIHPGLPYDNLVCACVC